jgi:hypothetical protein
VHTLQTIDVMATLCDKAGVTGLRRQISVIAMLVHDFGKAITRGVNDKTGQPNYIDHEKLGVPIVEAFANRLGFDEEETHLLAFVTEHHMRMHGLSKMRDVKVLALVEEAKAIDPDLVRLMGDVGRADEWGRMAVYDETSFIKEGKIIPHKEVELWDSYAEIAEGLIGIENEQAKLKQLRLLLK